MGIHALGDGIFLGVEVAEDGCPADFGRIGDAGHRCPRQTNTGH